VVVTLTQAVCTVMRRVAEKAHFFIVCAVSTARLLVHSKRGGKHEDCGIPGGFPGVGVYSKGGGKHEDCRVPGGNPTVTDTESGVLGLRVPMMYFRGLLWLWPCLVTGWERAGANDLAQRLFVRKA
jgi:hypothetical protein